MSNDTYEWEDHLTQAKSLAQMVSIAGRGLLGRREQSAFMGIADAIEDNISAAVTKVMSEIEKSRG